MMPSQTDIQNMASGRYRQELKQRQAQQNRQREQAEQERNQKNAPKGSRPTFLRPQDLQDGEYDLRRTLHTTLGMKEGDIPRPITRDDILAFANNVKVIKERYSKGITARDVIDFSNQEDIARANKQIHLVAPVGRKAGIVQFITNSGPDSNVVNHHVRVEFLSFESVVTNPDKQGKTTIKNRLANGKLRFECDCGRHSFWLRYIATIGGYNLGKPESAFPKYKNPELRGVACKHVLRVMHYIRSIESQKYLLTAVEKDRKSYLGKSHVHSEKSINNQLNQQAANAGSKRNEIVPKPNKTITETMQRSAQQAARRLAQNIPMSHIMQLHSKGLLTDEQVRLLRER